MLLSCNKLKAFGLIHQDFPKPCVSAGDTVRVGPGTTRSLPVSGDPGLQWMEDAFIVSEVDSEPLTIDTTVFRHDEDDNVENIPGLMQLPAVIRDCFIKYRSVFANDLPAERKIKCDPLHLTRKPGVELPAKCRRARLTPAHWRPRAKKDN